MADDTENPQISSYSDPIYDRLESFNRLLAKYWILLSLLIITTVVIVLIIRAAQLENPDSASASAFITAKDKVSTDDASALIALMDDPEITDEFRVLSANVLIQHFLDKNDSDQARSYLKIAQDLSKNLAEQSKAPYLQSYIALSKAAIQTKAGDFAAALITYDEVESLARNVAFAATSKFTAQFNRADLQVRVADTTDDAAEATELRQQALETYNQLRSEEALTRSDLGPASEYAYYDLLRTHPELASEDADDSTAVTEPETTEKAALQTVDTVSP